MTNLTTSEPDNQSTPLNKRPKKPHKNTRSSLVSMMMGFAGQGNTLTIPRPFIQLCQGDHLAALLLSQILYWQDRTADKDGWFAKSYGDWFDELALTESQVKRLIRGDKRAKNPELIFKLEDIGVETKLARSSVYNGAATMHYRVNLATFEAAVLNNAQNRALSGNDDLNIVAERLYTETTTEIKDSPSGVWPLTDIIPYVSANGKITLSKLVAIFGATAQLEIQKLVRDGKLKDDFDGYSIPFEGDENPSPVDDFLASRVTDDSFEFYALLTEVERAYQMRGAYTLDLTACLLGTSETGDWKTYRIEGGITTIEFMAWVCYYQIKQRPGAALPQKPELLNSYVMGWIAAGKPDLRASNGVKPNPLGNMKEVF